MNCKLQSMTRQTILFAGTSSTTAKSTKVSPKRTVKASPTFPEAPVKFAVHQSATRLMRSVASCAVMFAAIDAE